MARPTKNNCDYFPHLTTMRNHRKVKALRNKFGQVLGYAFWAMFIEYLTEQDGCEVENSEIELEMFAGELGVSVTEIQEMVDYCIRIEMLFLNRDNFIYSESLNDNLLPVFEKRKKSKEISKTRKRRENGTFIPENTAPLGISVAETPQSKVKYSRVKKRKVNKTEFKLYSEVCSLFDDKIDKNNWPDVYDKLIRLDGYTEERILEIVTEFRKDGNWWKDNGNFQSLVKLRKTNDEDIKYIDVFDAKMPKEKNANLGFGEFINANGNRTYGTSGVIVPNDASPRPSSNHIWSKIEQIWKLM